MLIQPLIKSDNCLPLTRMLHDATSRAPRLCELGVPADMKSGADGVSVKGAIVISRYGIRGRYQAEVAAEHGAVGCLIYSDPRDDAF